MAAVCKCKIGELPFNYLGIPFGADPRKVSSWNGVVERVERKLSGWKYRRNSLWGCEGGRKKMVKVKWKQICSLKDKEGTGVVDLRVKNKSLMAKWCWRFMMDREMMWRKIIAAKYGTPMQ
ncbi:hypothetical protein J1N35_026208 [Gossypium stocksii]|uniref:Reverse transcriptase zinc-binding domain-containing protein n=1 Tax=Gossypium stocksii TaxID=47602 RepID=A0A9D3V8C0_9ROSI|nr:hypothetical protein J1N35_026208 [Gossypium stocksii]